ncbi:MAG TPA: hypothetical protein VHZ81_14500 [Galbitalea sp.]|jgi:hypothetical protein|nr:hypothetical protein [Galbitalea sp.]
MASDSGSGKLSEYNYGLAPRNKRVTMTLAGSDPSQQDLADLLTEESLQTFINSRTIEEERTDAPMPVRFFTGRKMSGIVGYVPRGLEPVVMQALTRLEGRSNNRIPASIIKKGGKFRVVLLMGQTL